MNMTTADILSMADGPMKRAAMAQLQPTIGNVLPKAPRPRMNKLEEAYARRLESMKFNGEIAGYAFEAHKLRLADKTWYTPDFVVWLPDGRVQYHETKGFEREDAVVKFKTAAELFPFATFLMVRKCKGGVWTTIRCRIARVPEGASR